MRRLWFLIAAFALFAIAGGYLISRQSGGGGQVRTLTFNVTAASRMSPDRLRVKQNDVVTINVTSDRAGDVHLHGYDLHFEVRVGEVASQTFRADRTGDFVIEWESTGTPLGDLVVSP